MEPIDALDPQDLRRLLLAPLSDLPGLVLVLNLKPRYHCALDAIAITGRLVELRAAKGPDHGIPPASSARSPGSSSSTAAHPDDTVSL